MTAMVVSIPCQAHRLRNGLVVLLHRDPTLPLIATDLWYRVGSKDELPGRTGFAHLFEHLMFMGTDNVPGDCFDKVMEARGGANNASTSPDRTSYIAWGPRKLLPTILFLEADRMRRVGISMSQQKLDLQREVVRNERRQSYENRPYGQVGLVLPGLLYPEGHPYHHPVIGSHEDLEAATVEDVRAFFATWYLPNNACLAIAGDIDLGATLALVRRFFDDIPAGDPPPHREAAEYHLPRPLVHRLPDRVPAPQIVMTWHSPPRYAHGDAQLELAADLLADGASSRLEQALMHEESLVQEVGAWQVSSTLQSEFIVEAVALPGVPLERVKEVIDREIERFVRDGPTEEEVAKVRAETEADFVRSAQALLHRATDLCRYQTWLSDPDRAEWDLARYQDTTPESLQRVASQVLTPERRVILHVIPSTESASSPSAASSESPAPREPIATFDAKLPEDIARNPDDDRWSPPLPEVFDLEGPATGWHLPRRHMPLIALQLLVPFGAEHDPDTRAGTANLVAELLTEGAGTRDAKALATALDEMGTHLDVSAQRSFVGLRLDTLARHLDASLDLFADVLLRPRLEVKDFRRIHEQTLADLEQRRARPESVAAVVAQRVLMECIPGFSYPVSGYTDTVSRVEHRHVQEAHHHLSSRLSSLRVVASGDVESRDLRDAIAQRLDLTHEDLPAPYVLPDPETTGPLRVFAVDRPDAPQTVIRFTRRVPPLSFDITPALDIANLVFGGSFTSRLNQNLRERHGFTYGASSAVLQGARSGSFTLATSVETVATVRAVEEILNEMARLSEGDFQQRELEKARATDRNGRIQAFQTVGDTVGTYAGWAHAGFPPDAVQLYEAAVDALTVDDLNRLAALWLTPGPGVLVLVGDLSRFGPGLQELGLPDPIEVDPEGAR
jgi:zinc protease